MRTSSSPCTNSLVRTAQFQEPHAPCTSTAWPRLHSDKAAALGVEWPRGVLLHGPSGCGKSLIVQHAAAVAGALLHTITAATVAGTYVGMINHIINRSHTCNVFLACIESTTTCAGESEQRLRNAFAQAKHAAASGRPAVVFLDELDTLAPTRSAAGGGPEARLVGQLLTCIDQVALECTPPAHVVIVGATSAPSAVDPALRRPGRLDREILVGVPTRSDRQAMLVAALQRLPGNREDTAAVAVAAAVAGRTAGYTGADLTALVREAALASSGRVDGASLEAAMAVVRPSLARGAAVEVVPGTWPLLVLFSIAFHAPASRVSRRCLCLSHPHGMNFHPPCNQCHGMMWVVWTMCATPCSKPLSGHCSTPKPLPGWVSTPPGGCCSMAPLGAAKPHWLGHWQRPLGAHCCHCQHRVCIRCMLGKEKRCFERGFSRRGGLRLP